MALNQVSVIPAGVLRVISGGFLTPTRAFSKGAPTIFRKHMPSGIGTESLGMIGCIFAENGPLEGGIESSFSDTGWGAKGDFRWIFDPNPCIFEGPPPPHHFPKAHALRYGHRKFGDDQMYIRGEWALRRWHWIKFQWYRLAKGDFRWIFDPNPYIFEGGPPPFSESTCPQVWAQKVWGWSDVYIRGEWALRMWHWIKFQWYRLGC